MQTKLKILLCALFVLALAVSEVQAQVAYRLGAARTDVAQYGNNQEVGGVMLQHQGEGSNNDIIRRTPNVVTITFNSGGTAVAIAKVPTLNCGTETTLAGVTGSCNAATTGKLADDKMKYTLTVHSEDATDNIVLKGTRLNVSSLDVGAEVSVMASTASSDNLDFGTGPGLSATRQVATVKAGIAFKVTTGSRFYCTDQGMTAAKIKVTEGFNSAWEAAGTVAPAEGATSHTVGSGIGATEIKFKIQNVPSGVTFSLAGPEGC